jgi:hypothetical protein
VLAARRKDLADLRSCKFFRLKPLAVLPHAVNFLTTRDTSWLCRCDCGNLTIARSSRLKNGMKKSCGCYRSEMGLIKPRYGLRPGVGPAVVLPVMTKKEALLYRKFRWRIGYSRHDALEAIGKGVQ